MRELAGTRQHRVSFEPVSTEPLPRNTTSYIPRPQSKANRSSLYAVAPTAVPSDATDLLEPIEVGSKLVQIFHRSVKPKPIAARSATHQLTTEEFIEVKLATVRESTRHCFWPTDVLERFLAAEVISDRQGQGQ